jgi:hypothetical protein
MAATRQRPARKQCPAPAQPNVDFFIQRAAPAAQQILI